jgi:hypothetical protein
LFTDWFTSGMISSYANQISHKLMITCIRKFRGGKSKGALIEMAVMSWKILCLMLFEASLFQLKKLDSRSMCNLIALRCNCFNCSKLIKELLSYDLHAYMIWIPCQLSACS